MNSTEIELYLLSRGFSERKRSDSIDRPKTIEFSINSTFVYVKRDINQFPLVAHPSISASYSEFCLIAGVQANKELNYYFNSNMNAFPAKLNRGIKPTKYGIDFGFENTNALDRFLNILSAVGQKSAAQDLNEIFADVDLTETERLSLIAARIGQGKFRDNLMKEFNSKCQVTGISRNELLRASHIKPWSKSSNGERIDCANGLLLSVQLDALFDSGLITFDDFGMLLSSSQLTYEEVEFYRLSGGVHIEMNGKRREFMAYHRNDVFKK